MKGLDPQHIPWRDPWHPIAPENASQPEEELHREMCPAHVLFGRKAVAIGARQDCDDVLFALGDIAPRFAVVHLTFRKETLPLWPYTVLFGSLEEWVAECLVPDADDWALGDY